MWAVVQERGRQDTTQVCCGEKEASIYVNKAVPCSVRAVRDGFEAEVAWQCIGARERSQEMTAVEQQRPPRAKWNAKNALEPLAGWVISRDTSAFVSEENQCKNSKMPSSV